MGLMTQYQRSIARNVTSKIETLATVNRRYLLSTSAPNMWPPKSEGIGFYHVAGSCNQKNCCGVKEEGFVSFVGSHLGIFIGIEIVHLRCGQCFKIHY